MKITSASHLSPAELTAELCRLARCEREATAALIVHLAEFDRRRLYEGAGYPSLFRYMHVYGAPDYAASRTRPPSRRRPENGSRHNPALGIMSRPQRLRGRSVLRAGQAMDAHRRRPRSAGDVRTWSPEAGVVPERVAHRCRARRHPRQEAPIDAVDLTRELSSRREPVPTSGAG
jgi:hypothetical protein